MGTRRGKFTRRRAGPGRGQLLRSFGPADGLEDDVGPAAAVQPAAQLLPGRRGVARRIGWTSVAPKRSAHPAARRAGRTWSPAAAAGGHERGQNWLCTPPPRTATASPARAAERSAVRTRRPAARPSPLRSPLQALGQRHQVAGHDARRHAQLLGGPGSGRPGPRTGRPPAAVAEAVSSQGAELATTTRSPGRTPRPGAHGVDRAGLPRG